MKNKKINYLILFIIIISILRFIISFSLPSYYLGGLKYDDSLMIKQANSLLLGDYLGHYSKVTLVKGIVFPFILYYIKLLHVSYSSVFTILYILSCLYFLFSIKPLIKNKSILIIIYCILLFNPISYSGEVFQRLYLNNISITEILLFLGALINVITAEKENIIYYIILGTISSVMLLTRNDNIWIYIILLILFIHKIYKNHSIKSITKNLIPIFIIVLGFNTLSLVNYKYYKTYTYNELEHSSFKTAYKNIQKIKTKKVEKVAITKNTLKKLSENTKTFDFTKEDIDNYYKNTDTLKNGEIDNGNIIWFLRSIIYEKERFRNGKEVNLYFEKLNDEIEKAFQKKKLDKTDSIITSIFINKATKKEILNFPKAFIKTVWYTSSFQNIRVFSQKSITELKRMEYDSKNKAYNLSYNDYRHSENMIQTNPIPYSILKVIYIVFTISFTIIGILIYITNIKNKSLIICINHLIVIIYLLIISGVVYTHITSFNAIRYRYLSNIYILQSIFICLNLAFYSENKKSKGEMLNDIGNNTSIQRRKINSRNNQRNKKNTSKKQTRQKIRNNSSK